MKELKLPTTVIKKPEEKSVSSSEQVIEKGKIDETLSLDGIDDGIFEEGLNLDEKKEEKRDTEIVEKGDKKKKKNKSRSERSDISRYIWASKILRLGCGVGQFPSELIFYRTITCVGDSSGLKKQNLRNI